jgi:hypothetical protein
LRATPSWADTARSRAERDQALVVLVRHVDEGGVEALDGLADDRVGRDERRRVGKAATGNGRFSARRCCSDRVRGIKLSVSLYGERVVRQV